MIKKILSYLLLLSLLSLTACYGGKKDSSKKSHNSDHSAGSDRGSKNNGTGGDSSGKTKGPYNPKEIDFKSEDNPDLSQLVMAARSLSRDLFMLLDQESQSFAKFYGILSVKYTQRMLEEGFFEAKDAEDSSKLNQILAKRVFRKLHKVYSLLENQNAELKLELQGQQTKLTLKVRVTDNNRDYFKKIREELSE